MNLQQLKYEQLLNDTLRAAVHLNSMNVQVYGKDYDRQKFIDFCLYHKLNRDEIIKEQFPNHYKEINKWFLSRH